ncbi:MAG: family 16 glycosylhydrolase [Alphaproteobacteria bacterium]|nr:family 16 glycosylhydrolase [Alphaproteobacteria bacterium]MBU2143754.1 family 16 glycosylhydrolase [Alphaproteobacteria bacterium]MBU2195565.1 family 16 glycosylhydrolase [Alphaproteobacteria bacterium]
MSNSSGMDAFVVSMLVAVCSFGILTLSAINSPMAVEVTIAQIEAPMPEAPAPASVDPVDTDEIVVAPAPAASTAPQAPSVPTLTKPPALIPSSPGFISLLGDAQNDAFYYRSDFANPDGHYGGDWSPKNIKQSAEGAALEVHREESRSGPYTGAEMKTVKTYGYGRYEVVMRPSKGSGLVSSFFTYTGSYEGTAHDEIDIEFLGMDTSRVHFNYFRKGKTGASATFDLPFDASEADHLYAFEWSPEGITWFVDGRPYYKTIEGDAFVPRTPGSIIINNWTGKPFMSAWHGKPTFESGAAAHYSCISFSPLGEKTRACSDLFLPQRPTHAGQVTAQLTR